jgi:DNA-binding HxlR family transcriptional regulator
VRDLAGGPRRFVELQRVLPGISTEQLRSRLNRMVADGLLTRQRYREVPPRVDYELTERARDLLPVVGALARWGYRWAWGPPRPGEAIDSAETCLMCVVRGAVRQSRCTVRQLRHVKGFPRLPVSRLICITVGRSHALVNRRLPSHPLPRPNAIRTTSGRPTRARWTSSETSGRC